MKYLRAFFLLLTTVVIVHASQLVSNGLIFDPSSIRFGTVVNHRSSTLTLKMIMPEGQTGKRTVFFLLSPAGTPFRLSATEGTVSQRILGDPEFKLQVSVASGTAPGSYSAGIALQGEVKRPDGSRDRVTFNSIPLTATVVDALKIEPQLLNFGDMPFGQRKNLSLQVTSQITGTLNISSDSKAFLPNQQSLAVSPGQTKTIDVTFSGGAGGGSQKGTLLIRAITSPLPDIVIRTASLSGNIQGISGSTGNSGIDLVFVGTPTVNVAAGTKTISVTFTISNAGSQNSTDFKGEILLDGFAQTHFDIGPLTPDQQATRTISFDATQTGTHQVQVRLDRFDNVKEFDENNNLSAPVPVQL